MTFTCLTMISLVSLSSVVVWRMAILCDNITYRDMSDVKPFTKIKGRILSNPTQFILAKRSFCNWFQCKRRTPYWLTMSILLFARATPIIATHFQATVGASVLTVGQQWDIRSHYNKNYPGNCWKTVVQQLFEINQYKNGLRLNTGLGQLLCKNAYDAKVTRDDIIATLNNDLGDVV